MEKIKQQLFKVCPKTGKIRGINKDFVLYKILLPVFGLISLIWGTDKSTAKAQPGVISLSEICYSGCFLFYKLPCSNIPFSYDF